MIDCDDQEVTMGEDVDELKCWSRRVVVGIGIVDVVVVLPLVLGLTELQSLERANLPKKWMMFV